MAHTRDHSKVQYLVDQGIIRAVDVPDHPDRNKVYSCLGGMVDPVIDLSNRTLLRDGDILVLCTDGLWGPIASDEIGNWLTGAPILKAAPDMMREAERRAGPDVTTFPRSSCVGDRNRRPMSR
jgi:serine/threonine protein phosphatase PrpC